MAVDYWLSDSRTKASRVGNHDVNASFDQSGGEKDLLHLGHSEELFRLLVDQVKDYAIFALSPEGYIVTWNRGAQLLKGYRAEEIIGQHIQRFYTESDQQAGKPLRLLKQALEHGRVEDEGWRVRKDGSQFWADVIITALVDEKQNRRGYAKVTRDLTERRNAEESLREAKKSLEKRVAERTAELNGANAVLEERLAELEQFHDIVVGRELKLIELEREIQRLKAGR
jgi:PAS domain S-box-containing protein